METSSRRNHDIMQEHLLKVFSQNHHLKGLTTTADTENPSICITSSEQYGRFLIATRNISAGEVLFCETPLVHTPQAGAGPTCLRCLCILDKEKYGNCNRCGAPVCLGSCENMYHTDSECAALQGLEETERWSKRSLPIVNAALTCIRTWLALKENNELALLLSILQSDDDVRRKQPIGMFIDAVLVPLLTKRLKLSMSLEFIHHVCGVFDTNAFKVDITGGEQCRALVPLAAMLMHDCTANTDHWFFGGKCLIKATRDIPKGSVLTKNYTSALLGTENRIKHLSFTKCFQCTCKRCKDPTELGTHMSSVKCRSCPTGLLVPPPPSSDKEPSTKNWHCNSCVAVLPPEMVSTIARAGGFTNGLNGSREEIIGRLEDLAQLVGLQHYGTMQLLTTFLRKLMADNVETLSEEQLQDVVAMTEHLLPVAEVITPGFSLFVGELLQNNLQARAILWRRGTKVQESPLLPEVVCPSTNDELIQSRFRRLEAIHAHPPQSAFLEKLRGNLGSLGFSIHDRVSG